LKEQVQKLPQSNVYLAKNPKSKTKIKTCDLDLVQEDSRSSSKVADGYISQSSDNNKPSKGGKPYRNPYLVTSANSSKAAYQTAQTTSRTRRMKVTVHTPKG
jgi:hypothetical protein